MGYRVHLIAITGKDPATVHAEYGVSPSGQYDEIAESPVCGAELPHGNYVLYINNNPQPDEPAHARLSRNASVVECTVNETAMISRASGWANGMKIWQVVHNADEGIEHLNVTGAPLPQHIRETQLARQSADEDVDHMFDVPVELFVALGGVRFHQDIEGADPEPWQMLNRIQAPQITPKNTSRRWWWPFG